MRLVFFGTPEFASVSLKKLIDSNYQVVAAVTAPDKPKGRGMRLENSPVKITAAENGIPVLQPTNLKDESFLSELQSYGGDLFCVVAFRILPEQVFAMPPKGCINLHASLLPRYRGAAPINWAIINGESETGLTTFFIQKKVDTGNVILQEKIAIGPNESFGELHDKMAESGSNLLLKTVDLIERNEHKITLQDDSLVTAAPKLEAETGRIDWKKTALEIHNLVRGLSPKPGAYTYRNGKKLLVNRTRIIDRDTIKGAPGLILEADPKHGIKAACQRGILEILEIKPESGKMMSSANYVKGHRLKSGEIFGN